MKSLNPDALLNISAIEFYLIRYVRSLTVPLFSYWTPKDIIVLGRTNRRLYNLVKAYFALVWNPRSLLEPFFGERVGEVLDFMKSTGSIVLGPAMVEFFDRQLSRKQSTLDICVERRVARKANELLEKFFYAFVPGGDGTTKFTSAIILGLGFYYPGRRPTGDRVYSARERDAAICRFRKLPRIGRKPDPRVIRIHVVNCTPLEHVLSLHSSGLMNFMTYSHAVSLFPRSTFINRLTFACREERVPSETQFLSHRQWFDVYCRRRAIKIVTISSRKYLGVELGRRFMGDDMSWTIPIDGENGMYAAKHGIPFIGPSFDVLDWTYAATDLNCYLRIGEPRIWRYVASRKFSGY
ncbi:hypothetical protein CVT26_004083 [Gymnopilus dilepis]|uniref:Uncharacterized protein n=1 Tax=Gymnopilus dilepis TaxID=231916 RepID=A0A409W262_9AGAR|nr:hypothetical protein CVT26_004083 [Gymnopilus dilepis]